MIGDWLTEINVTSPTCFQEITQQTGFNVAGMFIDELERACRAERMVGILIVSHSIYGEALIRCVSHVLGQAPERVMGLGMTVRDDPDEVLEKARELISAVDEGDGVLVLTDILGATPSNLATQLIAPGRCRSWRA